MKDKKKLVCAVCLALMAAYMIIFLVQMGNVGQQAGLFFDIHGLPTLAGAISGVIFGALFIVLGRNISEDKTAMRKLCKVIGILEIISALLVTVMGMLIRTKL